MKRLLQQAENNESLIEILDELVHELKSLEASSINNAGPDAQLEYLLINLSPEEVARELGLVNDKTQRNPLENE